MWVFTAGVSPIALYSFSTPSSTFYLSSMVIYVDMIASPSFFVCQALLSTCPCVDASGLPLLFLLSLFLPSFPSLYLLGSYPAILRGKCLWNEGGDDPRIALLLHPGGDFFAAEYGQAFCNFMMPRLCCFPFHSIPSCHVHIANKHLFPRFILVSFARTNTRSWARAVRL
jgi:hypothetical protein